MEKLRTHYGPEDTKEDLENRKKLKKEQKIDYA